MAKNWDDTLDEITRLQGELLEIHPGYHDAREWLRVLHNRAVFNWTWNTELLHPESTPGGFLIMNAISDDCDCWCNEAWKNYREKTWAALYWKKMTTRDILSPKEFVPYRFGPDVPPRSSSQALFRQLLRSVPSSVIQWAKSDSSKWNNDIIKRHVNIEDCKHTYFAPSSLKISLADRRARYWCGKFGEIPISEIDLPFWASEAEESRLFPIEYLRRKKVEFESILRDDVKKEMNRTLGDDIADWLRDGGIDPETLEPFEEDEDDVS